MSATPSIRASEPLRVGLAPRLVNIRNAAAYLAVGTKVIRHLIQSGELPYIQHLRGRSPYLLDVEDLNRWILLNKQRAGE